MEHWIKTDYNENQGPYETLNQTDYDENQGPYETLNQNRL